MIKYIKFIEKTWLMLSILTFIMGLYFTFTSNIYDALFFFGFSVVAILLFSVRRKQRRVYERKEKH